MRVGHVDHGIATSAKVAFFVPSQVFYANVVSTSLGASFHLLRKIIDSS